jgi:hypothetical protein
MKQPPIQVLEPGYAYGYIPANVLFRPMHRVQIRSAINHFQAREQAVMRMFDRTIEINP